METNTDYEASSGMSRTEIMAARDVVLSQKTLTVAVNDETYLPDMGVSPFVRRDDGMYIYTSHLSGHVRSLIKRKSASFIIVIDEAMTKNIWARHRLKFSGSITEIDRSASEFSDLCELFTKEHGNTMTLIKGFTDFHMLRITPENGILVLGFAKAFCVSGIKFEIIAHIARS